MVQKNTLNRDVLEQRVNKSLQKEIVNFNKCMFFYKRLIIKIEGMMDFIVFK